MLFPSVIFLFYFLPAALLLHFLCGFSRTAQNACLLVLSLLFYAWGEPLNLVPLLFVILVNYGLGLLLGEDRPKQYRRSVVTIAVALNVAMLAAVLCVGRLVAEIPPAPVGVAFFTLQAMTYVFEVARGKAGREKNILNVGLFVALFPTVLFGPILRYTDLADQIRFRRVTVDLLGRGASRFVIGFAKLLILGAPLNLVANHVFTMAAMGGQVMDVPVMLAWLGVITFGLQLYLCFSAWSDMAIGLAALFGFSLKENFNYPLVARSVTDFWSRWYISLYKWFYTYVYILMGGPRPKRVRIKGILRPRNFVLRNLFVLWLLIGLWHGASVTYLVWGLWVFLFFLFEWIVKLPNRRLRNPLWHLYVFLAVTLGWVFFRCHGFYESMNYFSNLLGLSGNGLYSGLAVILVKENWLAYTFGLLFSTPVARIAGTWLHGRWAGWRRYPAAILYPVGLAGLFCLGLVYLSRVPVPAALFW